MELYTKTNNILVVEENPNINSDIKNPIIISDMISSETAIELSNKYFNCNIDSSNFIELNKNNCLNKNCILKIFSQIKGDTGAIISIGSSYSNNVLKILKALIQGWNFSTNSFDKKENNYNIRTYTLPLTLSLDSGSGLFYYFSHGNAYVRSSSLVAPDSVILIPEEITKNSNDKNWIGDAAISLILSLDIIPNKNNNKIVKELNDNLAILITDYIKYCVIEKDTKRTDFLKYGFMLNNYNVISNLKSPSTNIAMALPLVLTKTATLEEAMFHIFFEKIDIDYFFNGTYYNYICRYLIQKRDYDLIESVGNLKFLLEWIKRDIFGYKLKELSIKEGERKQLAIKVDRNAFEKYPGGFNLEKIERIYDSFLYIK